MENTYDGVLEKWKLDLINELMRRKGFRRDEQDDAMQRVVIVVANFKYEPEKSNSATERTVLTAVIDNQLTNIQRTQARFKNNHKKHCRACGMRSEDEPVLDETHIEFERRYELKIDVQTAMHGLSAEARRICDGLAAGKSEVQIAAELGCTRYQVSITVQSVRELFVEFGLGSN